MEKTKIMARDSAGINWDELPLVLLPLRGQGIVIGKKWGERGRERELVMLVVDVWVRKKVNKMGATVVAAIPRQEVTKE